MKGGNKMEEEIKEAEVEEKKEEPIEVKPKENEFYLAEIPESFSNVIAVNGKQVNADALVIKMANALIEAGLIKAE